MGIQAFLLPASINAIIAQRLIRRLCDCKKPISANDLDEKTKQSVRRAIARTDKKELADRVPKEILASPVFYEPCGCEKCNQTGYKGRVGIYEIMEITPKIKTLILANASGVAINEEAITEGMISLEQDGIMKALNGLTSLMEVYAAAKEE